jgi:hypothetical protein
MSWTLIEQCTPNFFVHVANNVDASLVLFFGDQRPDVLHDLVSELADVHFVRNEGVWPVHIAVEKDLFDGFFT